MWLNVLIFDKGMKKWWLSLNTSSIDGLPSMESCFNSDVPVKSYIPDPKITGVRLDAGKGRTIDEERGDIELTPEEERDMKAVKAKKFGGKGTPLGKVSMLINEWKEMNEDVKVKIIWAFVAGIMINSFFKVVSGFIGQSIKI